MVLQGRRIHRWNNCLEVKWHYLVARAPWEWRRAGPFAGKDVRAIAFETSVNQQRDFREAMP
jgi:hypothetical protein